MARTTMAGLIQEVRLLADVGAADYTAGTVSYWTDDQIQALLDQYRMEVRYSQMQAISTPTGAGTSIYTEYWSGLSCWENSPVLYDNTYGTITGGTATYTFDTNRGVANFVTNTAGLVRLITGTVYDLNAVAAEIWNRKAAHVASRYDVSTDNHSMSRSQLSKQYKDMARTFSIMPPAWNRGAGGDAGMSTFAERGDMSGCY